MMIARMRLLYILLSATPLGYFLFKVLTTPSADRNPNPMGLVWCLLLFTVVPYVGYLLLFKLLPGVLRSVRQ